MWPGPLMGAHSGGCAWLPVGATSLAPVTPLWNQVCRAWRHSLSLMKPSLVKNQEGTGARIHSLTVSSYIRAFWGGREGKGLTPCQGAGKPPVPCPTLWGSTSLGAMATGSSCGSHPCVSQPWMLALGAMAMCASCGSWPQVL